MGYYNYHAQAKNLIFGGHLIDFRIVDRWNAISPALVLFFDNHRQIPLRAQTAQGERVALTSSESVPAGSTIEFTVQCLLDNQIELVKEWLDYGAMRGFGQWRNSGKGRYTWEEIK